RFAGAVKRAPSHGLTRTSSSYSPGAGGTLRRTLSLARSPGARSRGRVNDWPGGGSPPATGRQIAATKTPSRTPTNAGTGHGAVPAFTTSTSIGTIDPARSAEGRPDTATSAAAPSGSGASGVPS